MPLLSITTLLGAWLLVAALTSGSGVSATPYDSSISAAGLHAAHITPTSLRPIYISPPSSSASAVPRQKGPVDHKGRDPVLHMGNFRNPVNNPSNWTHLNHDQASCNHWDAKRRFWTWPYRTWRFTIPADLVPNPGKGEVGGGERIYYDKMKSWWRCWVTRASHSRGIDNTTHILEVETNIGSLCTDWHMTGAIEKASMSLGTRLHINCPDEDVD